MNVVFFLLGDSTTSEFYVPAFRNTVSSIFIGLLVYTAYEDGIECSETSVHKIQTPRNYPKERIEQNLHSKHISHGNTNASNLA